MSNDSNSKESWTVITVVKIIQIKVIAVFGEVDTDSYEMVLSEF